jgi:hypothetical protein
MTVAEMLARISAHEIAEWLAYSRLEPFGEFQQEYRAALVASTVANTARDEKKHKEPFEAEEFMRKIYLDKNEPEEANPDKTLFEKAKMIFGNLLAKKKEG